MAAQPLIAGLPPDLDLPGGYTFRFDAVDPTTGATVSGVKVSAVAIGAADLAGALAAIVTGPFMLVPGPGA